MKIDMKKIAEMLDSYQEEHGTVSVRLHENVNACTTCYTGGGCSGTCRSTCVSVCRATGNSY